MKRAAKAKTSKRQPARFAVIGQGYFAQAAILPAFKEAPGCQLKTIFSEDETKLRALKRKYDLGAALGYLRSVCLLSRCRLAGARRAG